jgi:A/G-specific adenine glycosylase
MPAAVSSSKPALQPESSQISAELLDWYKRNARQLPWRGQSDPYKIWISEIMLQQTQVETVIPYFRRWMDRFPTLSVLAQASEQEILQVWEGLGYYSRARNLLKAARLVVKDHQGSLPTDRKALEELPGIGRYTAGAIASIAFGRDEAALDGNIRRVLARLFNLEIPARSKEGERRLWELAQSCLPQGCAGDFNQAMMDLGATLCVQHNPACERCPLARLCQARQLGLQERRPVVVKRGPVPHITVAAAVIQVGEQVLIARRPANGLLGGLWEFPGGKVEAGESLEDALRREIGEELGVIISVGEPVGIYKHAYTHFKVTLHAFYCRLLSGDPQPIEASELRWVNCSELSRFPMGKIDRQIARQISLNSGL